MTHAKTDKYEHTKKAGNEGDLIKHALLARVVDHLSEAPRLEPFLYAESHCGRAIHPLRSGGEWENGIKVFSGSQNLADARHFWTDKDGSPDKLPNLRPYAELFPEPVTAGMAYPGSSMVVFRILTEKAIPFRFQLWDVDEEVCLDLYRTYPQWAQVSICRGDGLDGVRRLVRADLVLIDPFKLENGGESLLKTMEAFSSPDIRKGSAPFLCWTPLVNPDDEASADEFYRETHKRYFVERVRWAQSDSKGCWGCQITASKVHLGDCVAATLGDLLQIMPGWSRL